MWYRYDIRAGERGLRFVDGALVEVLGEGVHWRFATGQKCQVDIVSTEAVWLERGDLALIKTSEARPSDLLVLDVHQEERALVWIDGRYVKTLLPGQYGLWTSSRAVLVEVFEVDGAM